MPRIIERTVYRFHELSEKAKERARDDRRSIELEYDWWEFVYEQAVETADMLGIKITTKPVKLVSGKTRHDPCIYFSGFCSQGDGASFQGHYFPKLGIIDAIANEFCADSKLHKIAEQLTLLQVSSRVKYGQLLRASIGTNSSHYSHSGTMNVSVFFVDDDTTDPDLEDAEELTRLMRSFADWIYSQLEAENDYLMSDEYIDEILSEDDCEFDEFGALI